MASYSKRGNIIKWYEYTMEKKEDENLEALNGEGVSADEADGFIESDDASGIAVSDVVASDGMASDVIASNGVHERYGDEEIDLDSIDMDDSDKELVASIMAKFKDAKQESVDSLFGDM